jgi:hypothetical protein
MSSRCGGVVFGMARITPPRHLTLRSANAAGGTAGEP